MILITGGLGFIGARTTRALLDMGQSCVVTQHRSKTAPEFLVEEVGDRLVLESVDVENDAALLALGERHAITGIVHLADPVLHRLWRMPGDDSPLLLDGLFDSLGHVLRAAAEWGVTRVSIASSIGVYEGLTPGLWSEDAGLQIGSSLGVITAKRCAEELAVYLAGQMGLDVVRLRISSVWGPGAVPANPFSALPALVHAAARGSATMTPPSQPVYGDAGSDLCHVTDCARGIALIQTAEALNHTVYNVGSGRVTTNAEVVAAIQAHVPDFAVELADGRDPDAAPADPVLDLKRIQQDTAYEPSVDLATNIREYIEWLRAGHTQ